MNASSIRRPITAVAAAVALGGLLAGCIVVPAGRTYPAFGDQGDVVMTAPPDPVAETVTVAPYPGYIWIGGFWNWYGGRYNWVGGRWAAPRPGYGWVPHRWYRQGPGWRAEPGHWGRR